MKELRNNLQPKSVRSSVEQFRVRQQIRCLFTFSTAFYDAEMYILHNCKSHFQILRYLRF
jgi:hypothetical protein